MNALTQINKRENGLRGSEGDQDMPWPGIGQLPRSGLVQHFFCDIEYAHQIHYEPLGSPIDRVQPHEAGAV
jgi:hypothetical protein